MPWIGSPKGLALERAMNDMYFDQEDTFLFLLALFVIAVIFWAIPNDHKVIAIKTLEKDGIVYSCKELRR